MLISRCLFVFLLIFSQFLRGESSKPHRIYGLLASSTSGSLSTDTDFISGGGGWGFGAGFYLTPNLSLGLRYQEALTVGAYVLHSQFIGGELDWIFSQGEKNRWHFGAALGNGNFTGIFILPGAAGNYAALIGGPNFGFERKINSNVSVLANLSVWWIPSGFADSTALLSSNKETFISDGIWANLGASLVFGI